MTGEEFKIFQKIIGVDSKALADMLGCSKASIAAWRRGERKVSKMVVKPIIQYALQAHKVHNEFLTIFKDKFNESK